MKLTALLLFACALTLTVFGMGPFVILDKSEKNREAVARFDQDVRKRIDFAALKNAVNEYITSRKKITVGRGKDEYSVDLQLYRLTDDWRLVGPYGMDYVSGRWFWCESDGNVKVSFGDYAVSLTLVFHFSDSTTCSKIQETIEDHRDELD